MSFLTDYKRRRQVDVSKTDCKCRKTGWCQSKLVANAADRLMSVLTDHKNRSQVDVSLY